MASYTYGNGQVGPGSARIPANQHLGLDQASPYRFEPPASMRETSPSRPIDFLSPGSPQHAFVLKYLMDRLSWSEQKMAQFYPRYQANEQRLQAYVTLPEYDRILDAMKNDRKPPEPNQIVVPYTWASQQTIVTYLLHTFGGRKPIVQVGAWRGEQVQRAKSMETLLQYNFDFKRYVYHLYNLFTNGELYGVAIQRNMWTKEYRRRTTMRNASPQMQYMMAMNGMQAPPERVTENVVSFEGNDIAVISPYMFFPDPRVPMVDVAEKGEFVFWRAFEGRHMLLRAEASGSLKWVKYAGDGGASWGNNYGGDSMAGIRALGDSLTNGPQAGNTYGTVGNNIQVDQGTIDIIPAELGLGQSTSPEKWMFTVLNKRQIVQAEPMDANHGRHPISVCEPNAFGHSFGQISTADLNAPIQDLLTWMVNSHMFNVRASLNNFFFVDPNRVEMDDFLDPQPGGLIRLKSTPFGQVDPRMAAMQMQVGDVTRSHLSDFSLIQRIGNDMTGATDNMRGLQDAGSRKTATEVRTSFEAGGSRLASRAMIYGATAISPGAQQMASNFQQYMSDEAEFAVLGADGREHSVRISPQGIEGDFFFPIHDGTLPLDKVALLDSWRQLFMGIVQDPTGQMQREYNAPAIFRFMAKLSGAQNIDEFSVTAGNPAAIQQQAQAGNLVPMSQLPGLLRAPPFNPLSGV
jgi:hypothetical protein